MGWLRLRVRVRSLLSSLVVLHLAKRLEVLLQAAV